MKDPTLAIYLFGGVRAVIGDDVLDVGPPKCQTVLAALALSAGSPVPLGRLADLVWGPQAPVSAERTLQSYIARLRSSLGSDTITRAGSSYCLDVAGSAVDVARFEHHLDEGRVADALAEWKGLPLDGLNAPGLDPSVTALTERWLGAVEADLQRRIETDPAAAIGELTELTAQHPFREGLWAQLMTALYKSGRQADALAAYRSAYEHLVEQLGLEPGPRLQDLEAMILGHDERLGPAQSVNVPRPNRPSGTVTFAFIEVDNAIRSWDSYPLATTPGIARLHDLVQATAVRHSGSVFSAVDDTFGVAFTSPDSAVAWATELHAMVSNEPWPVESALTVRVGINTGGAEQHASGGYYGPAVNLAARLAGIGHGDQTLISNATAGMVDHLELSELGTYRLDGIVTDQRIYQLGSVQYPPLLTERANRGNAPRRLGRLIGRNDLLATVADALSAFPVVTLVGPGGIGKTQLALATANTVTPSEEAWVIELANIRSGEHLSRAVADTLGIQDMSGETLTSAITRGLESRHALVILDNCEHIIGDVAVMAQAIIQHCPNIRLLATSRERLGLVNERVLTVTPLEPTTSAELFIERATAIAASFDPNTTKSTVEEICARLDGIPLAIELAAARTTSLTPAELLDRLDRHRSLRLLTGGPRTSSDRHRTLQAAIKWSYDLLTPPEQDLFQRLSAFTSTFDLAAAEAIADDQALDVIQVDHLLGHLVDQSMLTIESGPFGRRFRFLEPIHDFAKDRLDQSDHAADVATSHTRWCLTQITDIGQQLAGWDEIEGVARLDELWPNIRAAFDRACTSHDRHLAKRLVRPILGEIVLRGQYELGDWVERILAISPPDDDETRVFGLYWAAHRYTVTRNPQGYQRLVERYGEPDHILMTHARAFVNRDYQTMADCLPAVAVELRRQGDHHLAERVDISIATALLHLGRYQEQEDLAHQLIDRYRQQGPPTYLNWSITQLGFNASFQDQPDRADAYFNQANTIEVPARTHTPNRPLEARRAFRRGEHLRAFHILRAHIDEMLTADNIQAGLIDCIEFINMMSAIDHPIEATRILRYLETTGLFDAPGWRTLIADSTTKIASSINEYPSDTGRPDLDHQQALKYMTDVLDQLTSHRDDQPRTT